MFIANKKELSKYAGKRKHGTQLAKHEEQGLWDRLKSVKESDWKMIGHAIDRLNQKGIKATKRDIVSTIHNAKIVEYKIDHVKQFNEYHERVVLRSNTFVNGSYNLHAVYSLTNNRIVSVWMNHKDDLHKTLDWNLYDESMKVFV